MKQRIKSLLLATAAIAALALGGSALAGASSSEPVTSTDSGAPLQQGDQSTPDVVPAPAKHHAKRAAAEPRVASDPAGANDTTSPDALGAAGESDAENGSETGASDGPGGHADPPGEVQNEYQGSGQG